MSDAERLAQYRHDVKEIVASLHERLPQLKRDEVEKAERQAEDVKQAARQWRAEMLKDETLRNPSRTPLSAITANLDNMRKEVKKLALGKPFRWSVDQIVTPTSVSFATPLSLPRPDSLRLLVAEPVREIVEAAEQRAKLGLALAERRVRERAGRLEEQANRWQEKMLTEEKEQLFLHSKTVAPQNMLTMRHNLAHMTLFGPMTWPVSEFFQQSIMNLAHPDARQSRLPGPAHVATNSSVPPAIAPPLDFAAEYQSILDATVQQAHVKLESLVRGEVSSIRHTTARISGEAASWKVSILSEHVQADLLSQHHVDIERRLQDFRKKTSQIRLDTPFDWSVTQITKPFITDPHRAPALSVKSLSAQQTFLDRVRHFVSAIVDEIDARLVRLCGRAEDRVNHTAQAAAQRVTEWRSKMLEPTNTTIARQRWTRTAQNLQTLQASVQQMSLSHFGPWPVSDLLGRVLRLDANGHLYGLHGAGTIAAHPANPHDALIAEASHHVGPSTLSQYDLAVNPYAPQPRTSARVAPFEPMQPGHSVQSSGSCVPFQGDTDPDLAGSRFRRHQDHSHSY